MTKTCVHRSRPSSAPDRGRSAGGLLDSDLLDSTVVDSDFVDSDAVDSASSIVNDPARAHTGMLLAGSPHTCNVVTTLPCPSKCLARGNALTTAVSRQINTFEMLFRDRLGQVARAVDLDVFVEAVPLTSPRSRLTSSSSLLEPSNLPPQTIGNRHFHKEREIKVRVQTRPAHLLPSRTAELPNSS